MTGRCSYFATIRCDLLNPGLLVFVVMEVAVEAIIIVGWRFHNVNGKHYYLGHRMKLPNRVFRGIPMLAIASCNIVTSETESGK